MKLLLLMKTDIVRVFVKDILEQAALQELGLTACHVPDSKNDCEITRSGKPNSYGRGIFCNACWRYLSGKHEPFGTCQTRLILKRILLKVSSSCILTIQMMNSHAFVLDVCQEWTENLLVLAGQIFLCQVLVRFQNDYRQRYCCQYTQLQGICLPVCTKPWNQILN